MEKQRDRRGRSVIDRGIFAGKYDAAFPRIPVGREDLLQYTAQATVPQIFVALRAVRADEVMRAPQRLPKSPS